MSHMLHRTYSRDWLQRTIIISILSIAAILRLYRLGLNSLWYDEIGQALIAHDNSLWGTFLAAADHAGNAPFDYIITHLTLHIGNGEAILRLPAVLFGVASVFLLYALVRDQIGVRAALTAAVLLAVLPLHIRYSRELRFIASPHA